MIDAAEVQHVANEAAEKAVGWLEEAPGVKSSTRLFAAILIGAGVAVSLTGCGYVAFCLGGTHAPDSSVLMGFAAMITALVGSGAVAIINRTKCG
jgi:hypothetical protein